jgi:hypothetical protein
MFENPHTAPVHPLRRSESFRHVAIGSYARQTQADYRIAWPKFVIDARGDIGACLRQHEAELRDACKAKRAATVDKKGRTETPSQGTTPEMISID